MAFSEKLKKEVRKLSDGRCVICHRPFVDIHHIKPQNENGSDTIDNAVALCGYCHDIFGDNKKLRKQLKELRDLWYQKVSDEKNSQIIERHYVYEKIKVLPLAKSNNDKMVAICHVVLENEDFNDAAKALIELTREAQKKAANRKRSLYLDIDGHRLENGDFDHDMWELQFYFILQNLLYFYTEIHLPLITIYNPYSQLEEPIPDEFIILNEDQVPEELKKYESSILTTYIGEEKLKEYKIKES